MAYTTVNDPSVNFQIALYTGSSSSVTVTNDGNSNLQPDWLWIKSRSNTTNADSFDSSRGMTSKRLFPNLNNAEDSNGVASVTSDGFTTGTSLGNINTNGETYVAWQWKANGGTTASNSDGSITSTVQANTTAGLSIVTYTGNGSNSTIGHGLGVAPEQVIIKARDRADNWRTGSDYLTSWGYNIALDVDNAEWANSGVFNSTAPTSSVFYVGTDGATNASGEDYVAYCFKSIQGYSKLGSYIGNGNVDGPFIYTGFKPAYVITKNSSHAGGWAVMDNARNPFNVMNKYLITNTTDAEASGSSFDIDTLANGFKIRASNANMNADGRTYIYWAFAQEPLVGTNNVAATAQ